MLNSFRLYLLLVGAAVLVAIFLFWRSRPLTRAECEAMVWHLTPRTVDPCGYEAVKGSE